MFLNVSVSHFIRQQLIAELQTSVCDSKEEVVHLRQLMEKQLKEVNARWDEERQTITHRADQANKVCVYLYVFYKVNKFILVL